MKIAAVGECTIDRYLDQGIESVGGISLNFAIQAKRAGAEQVALLSCTGSDAGHDAVLTRLARAGIDTSHMHRSRGATASQTIRIAAGGERIFPRGGYTPGVLAEFRLSDDDLAFLGGFDIVAVPVFRQLASLSDAILRAPDLPAARVADLLDGEDLGPSLAGIDPFLEVFDLLFISGGEAMVGRLQPRSRHTRTLLVVTHGAAGSSALVRGRRYTEPAVAVPPEQLVDSTGCGDAFQAGFAVAWFRDRDVAAALDAGARRAAEVIRHLGATVTGE